MIAKTYNHRLISTEFNEYKHRMQIYRQLVFLTAMITSLSTLCVQAASLRAITPKTSQESGDIQLLA